MGGMEVVVEVPEIKKNKNFIVGIVKDVLLTSQKTFDLGITLKFVSYYYLSMKMFQ